MIGLDIGQQLTSAGFEVVGLATSVAQALRLIAKSGCDVAVLDINLGGETCEPVAEKLRASGTPFVVLTGYSADSLLSSFGDAAILRKPPRMDDLLAVLRGCLDAGVRQPAGGS
ncbi:MAG: response regulator [Bradyrhizobiaceae bacterium]|nr:response regulator [Bradyrhizobiaceae bacterium]